MTGFLSVEWLAEHFHFNPSDVEKAKFDHLGITFEVHFKKGKEKEANAFFQLLTKRETYPQYFSFNNSVCLNRHNEKKIRAAAMLEKGVVLEGQQGSMSVSAKHADEVFKETHSVKEASSGIGFLEDRFQLPAPDNFATLSQNLQRGIQWIQKFVAVCLDARQVRACNEEGKEVEMLGGRGSYAIHQSHGRHFQMNFHRVRVFVESVKQDLPLLKALMQSTEDAKQLQTYCDQHQKQIFSTKLFASWASFVAYNCSEESLERVCRL